MAIHLEIDTDETSPYSIWSNPEPGDRFSGRCIGVGETLEEAQQSARDELLTDLQEIDALEEPAENPRERGDDDGVEYGHPGDRLAGRE